MAGLHCDNDLADWRAPGATLAQLPYNFSDSFWIEVILERARIPRFLRVAYWQASEFSLESIKKAVFKLVPSFDVLFPFAGYHSHFK